MKVARLRKLAAAVVVGSSLFTGMAWADEPRYAWGLEIQSERHLCRHVLRGELFSRTELFFGRNRPGGVVSEEDFQDFLDRNVTPRFPDGLTIIDAKGQFRGTDAAVPEKENAKILILLYRFDRDTSERVEQIRTEYKQQFEQQSVLRVDEQSCVSF